MFLSRLRFRPQVTSSLSVQKCVEMNLEDHKRCTSHIIIRDNTKKAAPLYSYHNLR
jgi:hypothetical protein